MLTPTEHCSDEYKCKLQPTVVWNEIEIQIKHCTECTWIQLQTTIVQNETDINLNQALLRETWRLKPTKYCLDEHEYDLQSSIVRMIMNTNPNQLLYEMQ